MGALAEAMVAYAQPLLDETDGSTEQMNRAFSVAQICWNLALLPESECDKSLAEMRPSLEMDDREFEDFRQSVVLPMIRRHHDMFPGMSRLRSLDRSRGESTAQAHPTTTSEKYPGTGRNV